MKVIQTIQGTIPDPTTGALPEPVEVTYFTGDDIGRGLSALVNAATSENDRFYRCLAARIEF